MSDLAEIAADVAQALCSTEKINPAWHSGQGWETKEAPYIVLFCDGTNLTTPEWRCRCEDWLYLEGTVITFGWSMDEEADLRRVNEYEGRGIYVTELDCPLSEAPARLVSAVWRRMQEPKL